MAEFIKSFVFLFSPAKNAKANSPATGTKNGQIME